MIKNFTLLLVLISAQTMWAQLPAHVPTQDLAAWYDFNGNYQDASPNNNHLTAMGTTSRTTDRFNNPNSAFLASLSGYLTNIAPSFTLSPTQSFSMSVWWRKTGGTVAVMIGTTTNGNFITNMQSAAASNTSMFGTNRQGQAWIWASEPGALNVWEHYVCVYDAPNMTLYKNGVAVATNTYIHTGAQSVNMPLWIGRGVAGGNFQGSIDEVGIWTRALTPGEALQLYLGCTAGFSSQPQSATHTRGSNVQLIADRIFANTNSQWQIDSGNGFADILPSARFSGVNSDTLVINGVDFDLDQSVYRCINSSTICADTSANATLTVSCPVLIQNNPQSQTERVGQTASFSVSSTDSMALFQWQVDSGNGFADLQNAPDVNGVNTATLTLSNVVSTQDSTFYRCVISSNPCSDTSDVAMLSVINDISLSSQNLSAVRIYPNPTTSSWKLEVPAELIGNSFLIRDVAGKVIGTGRLQSDDQIVQAAHLPVGVYFLEIGSLNKSYKLIKE